MLTKELPAIVETSLFKHNIDINALNEHIRLAEDSEFLRNEVKKNGLICFIPDNAVLPRSSGASNEPLSKENAVLFKSPESKQREFILPNAGPISGMGIPEGVTLITGGGYHGKSTLLRAIESGIYNHIPGDGREYCVSTTETVKIRAYSGRYIINTDISTFIRNLPFDKDTTSFSTDNASGSTSQAANIIEALEIGAKTLLMDEDTCATNFMIRDKKMQKLVDKKDEPITTYIDKIRQIFENKKISTILVLGGAGDYFDVADNVIQMKQYVPIDVTEQAKKISDEYREKRISEDTSILLSVKERCPVAESVNPLNDYGKKSIYVKEINRINFGQQLIDLTDVEQITELSQSKAIAFALDYTRKYMNQGHTLKKVTELTINDIRKNGLDIISEKLNGNFAVFRTFELAFALNRMRGFKTSQF